MPGPQFIHVQTFSQKAGPAGNSVDQVIDEATRVPEFSLHVDAPQPPRLIFGDPFTFKDDHAAHVAARGTKVRVKGVEKVRAIRKDRHTLCTVIASYPLTYDQIDERGDDAKAHHADWEKRTLDFMQEKYGAQLRVVLAHDDEAHPHLHFWILPDNPDADAKMLHPGKAAKVAVEAEAKAEGVKDREAVKLGNDALKDAMREFLDKYFVDVSEPLGMLRDGPKRRRDSREQYKSRLAEAERNAASVARAKKADDTVQAAKIEVESDVRRSRDLKLQIAIEEDEAEYIIENARAEASSIKCTAEAEAAAIRGDAYAEGFAEGRAEAQAELSVLKAEVSEIRCLFDRLSAPFSRLMVKMKGVMVDMHVDQEIRTTAKSLFGEGRGFEKYLGELKSALKRVESTDNYIGGVTGQMQRERDVKLVTPYRLETAKSKHGLVSSPPIPTEDPSDEAGPWL